jgi:hypothetical protein
MHQLLISSMMHQLMNKTKNVTKDSKLHACCGISSIQRYHNGHASVSREKIHNAYFIRRAYIMNLRADVTLQRMTATCLQHDDGNKPACSVCLQAFAYKISIVYFAP